MIISMCGFFVIDSMGNLTLVFMLLGQQVWLGQKKNGDRCKCNEQQNVLNTSLSVVHGFIDITRLKSNVDQGGNKIGWLTTITRSTIIERTLGCSIIGASAVISPRSTGTIAVSVALDPFSSIVGRSPATAGGVNTSSGKHARVPVDGPLHKDEDNHVNKERRGEGNHRQKLKEEIKFLSEVDGVQTLEACTSKHLDNTKDNGKLHLEGIEKEQLVGRDVPHWIKTERVDRFGRTILSSGFSNSTIFDFTSILSIKGPTGTKQVKTKRETVVVNKTSIDSEETHHGNHVTARV
mmetsp:Transcript_27436/g.38603  ORF Transcript_27436/g.38603 Transcript_27436/m.38603 type:complete len:293 (-) Transcript_27436:1457-2335(-)